MSLIPGVEGLERKLDESIELMAQILEQLIEANKTLDAIWRNQ